MGHAGGDYLINTKLLKIAFWKLVRCSIVVTP